MKKLIVLFALVSFLAACSQPQPLATATIPPTHTLTATASRTTTCVPSYPPIFTSTFTPDWTKVIVAQATYIAYQATHDAENAQANKFPINCNDNRDFYEFAISPDNKWIAVNCVTDRYFLAINSDGSRKWEIRFDGIYKPHTFIYDISVASLYPYHWSLDSQFIYFFIILDTRPDVGYPYGNFEMNNLSDQLYRLDTQNGIWDKIGTEANYFSFSPTERRLASVYANIAACPNDPCPVIVSILDLKTGDQLEFTLNDTLAAGYFVWSNNGVKLFFSAVSGMLSQGSLNYAIYELDILKRSLRVIKNYEKSKQLIYPIGWDEENNILSIELENQYPASGVSFQYLDLTTNSFVIPPATDIP